jgi:hypothetical protein
MTKPRTPSLLQDELDREYAWRIREISDLRLGIASAQQGTEKTLIRAATALLYAHWEGFIKASTESYVEFLTHQGLTYKQLKRCYIAFGLKGHLVRVAQTKKSQPALAALDFLLDHLDDRASLPFRGSINTESNLRSSVFASIAGWVGVDIRPYETRFHFIDVSLCDRRNSIAHGEFLDICASEYIDLSNSVVQLLRDYKTDLENLVTLQGYKVA